MEDELPRTALLLQADIARLFSLAFSYPEEDNWLPFYKEVLLQAKESSPTLYAFLLQLEPFHPSVQGYNPFMKGWIPLSEDSYRLGARQKIMGFYQAFGIKPKGGENPDALPYQLEFLAFLLLKLAIAPDQEAKSVTASSLSRLLHDHLINMSEKILLKARSFPLDPFYAQALSALKTFLEGAGSLWTKDLLKEEGSPAGWKGERHTPLGY
jgi:nitrate reductase assembly molybdenum cofactor insertion protein NarJ